MALDMNQIGQSFYWNGTPELATELGLPTSMGLTTLCTIVLQDGVTKQTGTAVRSPGAFDASLQRAAAFEDATSRLSAKM